MRSPIFRFAAHFAAPCATVLPCLLAGCSDASERTSSTSGAAQPFAPGSASSPGSNSPRANVNGRVMMIDGYGRPAGMSIGTGSVDEPDQEDDETTTPEPQSPTMAPDELAIPTFETPISTVIPCSGCVQLSAIVDDINQRSQFTFNAGGEQATRVVWTILLPFNSDQLFIRSIVNGGDGPYTFMSANVFGELNEPVQLVQQFTGAANTLGIALGSAGAWTGDQRVSVFVDSVTLEGANVTYTFDADAEGFAAQGTERQPMVQLH
ncbi:MAG: hypothetical protein RL033_5539 [Pseudomonadota bacterium]|jgi:hypothetical protein